MPTLAKIVKIVFQSINIVFKKYFSIILATSMFIASKCHYVLYLIRVQFLSSVFTIHVYMNICLYSYHIYIKIHHCNALKYVLIILKIKTFSVYLLS